jgi:transcriptional regulator with XRE-family HTH domain
MKIRQKSAFPDSLATQLSELGQALTRMRTARRMTQAAAAERVGISRNTLSRIENGDPSIAVGQIVRYMDALGRVDLIERLIADISDPAVTQLTAREQTQRARPLSEKEKSKYDF